MTSVPRCQRCGEVIGIYEAAVLVDERGAERTSRAARPQLDFAGDEVFHLDCYQAHASGPGASAGHTT